MLTSDPLAFLDEDTDVNASSINAKRYDPYDPLSFLDAADEEPSQFLGKLKDLFTPQPRESDPNKSLRQNILDLYRPEEKTPEQLKAMSVKEKMDYAQQLQNLRELQQATGFGKGALSGTTFSALEYIPGLKPDEEDLMVGLGETVGSYLPISKLYNLIGKPLVNFAAKSPVARQGLMAFARMTGFGLAGATYEGTSDVVQGEIPSVSELAKTGATWAAIDAAMQTLGLGVRFGRAVNNIAEAEGKTAKQVLEELWGATKNYLGRKTITPDEIFAPEAEALMEQAEARAVKPKEATIEVRPVEETLKPAEVAESEAKVAAEPEIEAMEKGLQTFTTSKGSEYQVHEDGSTTRVKAARSEHPGQEGLQPKSEKTWYVTPEDSIKLGEFQTTGEGKKIVELPNGQLGVQYLTGTNADKIEQRTLVDFSKEPKEGLIPVEAWDDGQKIHFGNQIVRIGEPKESTEFKKQEDIVAPKPKNPKKEIIDERPILKEIMDLKESLKATKSQSQKSNINRAIKAKVDELGEVRKKNKALQKPLTKEFGKPDLTTKGLKQQKKFILDKIDEAIENPPDTNAVTIDVPGDGIFKINNEPRMLEKARDKVAKEWPVKGAKAAEKVEESLASEIAEETETELPKKKRQVPPPQTRPRQPVHGKKQAVARSKIIDMFRKAFTDPIRIGKLGKRRALGIHKLWSKVTRLLQDNDIETVAHEIGHNLHTTLYGGEAATPQEQAKNISAALRPYLNELKPLAHYEPWGMEGFAEFTRLYLTNPHVAFELAPKFYAKFEADLEAQFPEMKNALLQAREYYDTYLQGTPQSRIRAQTNYASDKGRLANIVDAVKKYLNPDFLKTQFLDDVYPAKRLVAEAFGIPISEVENLKDERNLYRSLRVLKGSVGKGDVFVLHETFDAKTLDKINGSLKNILKQLPNEESYREFNDYLIARRAIEKTAQDVETGINAGDAVAVEAELRPKYGKLALELDKYNDSLLKYALDAGLLSRQQYLLIKKNNVLYTPFQRVMEPEKGGVVSGGGKLQAGKPIKRMGGSAKDIIAPIESILKNTYVIITHAEKNLSGQVLAKLAQMKNMGNYVERIPTPIKLKGKIEGEQIAKELAKRFEEEGLGDLIEYDEKGKPVLREDIADAIPEVFLKFGAGQYPAGENIVTVYEDGKPIYYQVSPEIFDMWNKGIAPYTAGLLTKILRFPAKVLRAGAVLNPKFMLKNIVRDTWGSWLFTKYGKDLKDPVSTLIDSIYSPLAMLTTAAKQGGLYVEWMKAGGGMATMQTLDRESVGKKLDEVRHGYKPHQVVKWLRYAAGISEEVNRLAEFGKALEAEGKTRLGREIAAFAARDLSIDFAKIGLQTKALNQIITFWNATVQGGDKLLRTLNNLKDREEFLPRVLAFIVLPSLIFAWLNRDDDRVKEFYEQEKDFNFITFIGDTALKIPVPFETGVMAHGLTQRMFNYFIQKDPAAFEGFMGSIASAMLPNFIPTLANPIIEVWANKNFFTGAPIIPKAKEDLISRYQYKSGTSSSARLIGRAMTYVLGQETRSKAASPAIIDHFITSWTGGLGLLMIKISDDALEGAGLSDKIPGPRESIVEQLGLNPFVVRYPRANTKSIEKFYDNYADATSRRKSIKHAEKLELESEEDLGAAKERLEKIYDYTSLQQAYKSMQNCQREINNIHNDPTIHPDLKQSFIDDLYLQMIEFARAANEDIQQYRLTKE